MGHAIKTLSLSFYFMNILKLFGNPIILIIIYLLLIIEGDNFGGVFILYLVLAIPYGANYALFAASGIALLIIGYNLTFKTIYKPILYIIGYCLMAISLIIFFAKGNKWNTFNLNIPRFTFIIFSIFSGFYLTNTISLFIRLKKRRSNKLNIITSLP